jgi:hypothetical protein
MAGNLRRFLLPLLPAMALAQAPRLDTLRLQGPTRNRINILFLGDGYVKSEMKSFTDWSRAAVDSLFGEAWNPTRFYIDYAPAFNAFALETPSLESGVSRPDSGMLKNTFYGCLLAGPYNLGQCEDAKAIDMVKQYLPEYDVLVMVFNKADAQRATGGQIIYLHHGSEVQVVKHEIGHNHGGLWDEYVEAGWTGTCHEYPNTTAGTARGDITWKQWIAASTPVPTPETVIDKIGLFEGADYIPANCYRPKADCLMRGFTGATRGRLVDFCEVCREQMILQLYRKIDLIDSASPEEGPAAMTTGEKRNFKVNTVFPGDGLAFTWILDGKPVASASSPSVLVSGLAAGSHILRAVARDTTSAVRTGRDLLADTVTWKIEVTQLAAARKAAPALRAPVFSEGGLRFDLAAESRVTLSFLDARGRLTEKSDAGVFPPGRASLRLRPAPGAAFCRLDAAPTDAGLPACTRVVPLRTGAR